jgi:hypothetical protein
MRIACSGSAAYSFAELEISQLTFWSAYVPEQVLEPVIKNGPTYHRSPKRRENINALFSSNEWNSITFDRWHNTAGGE